jgi:hypothetical protein
VRDRLRVGGRLLLSRQEVPGKAGHGGRVYSVALQFRPREADPHP